MLKFYSRVIYLCINFNYLLEYLKILIVIYLLFAMIYRLFRYKFSYYEGIRQQTRYIKGRLYLETK